MLVISMLLVCSGFATATEAISFPNGRVVSNGIEKPTKEDVETQYVLAGMEISDIDFITGDYEMVTASSVRSVPRRRSRRADIYTRPRPDDTLVLQQIARGRFGHVLLRGGDIRPAHDRRKQQPRHGARDAEFPLLHRKTQIRALRHKGYRERERRI